MKVISLIRLLTLPVLAVALCTGARAADNDLSKMDKTFVQKAGIGGMFEVESGKVAQQNGGCQEVKDFGAKMVEDHGKAGDQLKSICDSKGVTLPSALDSTHQDMLDALKAKTGKSFDKLYLFDMTKAHNGDDALFLKEAKSGKDADLKAFAGDTEKNVIQMHIAMLKDIKSKKAMKM